MVFLWISITALGVCAIVFIVLVAKEHAPSPDDVAVAYERAWDRFDFATLWELSGPELRDGRDRNAFVAAKRAAYADQTALHGLVHSVTASTLSLDPESAIVVTTLVTDTPPSIRNQCTLARRGGRWFVVNYAHAAQ
jgi:hypothetical protein